MSAFPVTIEMLSRFRIAGGAEEDRRGDQRGPRGHRDRDAPAALGRCEVPRHRASHRRRGAPLRREEQGEGQADGAQGGRALDDRHADSPHALYESLGAPADLDHRHPAAKPASDQDGSRPLRRRNDRPRDPRRKSARGGQVFLVHNRVESIHAMQAFLERLLPGCGSASAHGQMPEKDLEKVILDFLDRKFDVLISTTIIESGLDFPNVNTIIINRADRFGLAELYQLRGRVGRREQQAYAYLLVPRNFSIIGDGGQAAPGDGGVRGAGERLPARDARPRDPRRGKRPRRRAARAGRGGRVRSLLQDAQGGGREAQRRARDRRCPSAGSRPGSPVFCPTITSRTRTSG